MSVSFHRTTCSHDRPSACSLEVERPRHFMGYSREPRKSRRALAGFANPVAVSLGAELPYQPAAIAFNQEKGVWSAKADALQARLLAKCQERRSDNG